MSGLGERTTPVPTTAMFSEKRSEPALSHVNSIKTFLGLDRPDSPMGKLAAHTRRKLIELEEAKAAQKAADNGAAAKPSDWHASMKTETFWQAFIKANRMQFLVTVGLFTLMVFWLFIIRTMHHPSDAQKAAGSSEQAVQQLNSQQQGGNQMNFGAPVSQAGSLSMPQQTSAQSFPAPQQTSSQGFPPSQQPSGFPLPQTSGNIVASPYAQQGYQAAPTYPIGGNPSYPVGGSPAYPVGGSPAYPAGGTQAYPAGGTSAYPAGGTPAYPLAVTPTYPPGGTTSQTGGLYPTRAHASQRHQTVVNR